MGFLDNLEPSVVQNLANMPNTLGEGLASSMQARQKQQAEQAKLLLDMDKAALTKNYIRTTPDDPNSVDLFGTKDAGIVYKAADAGTNMGGGVSNTPLGVEGAAAWNRKYNTNIFTPTLPKWQAQGLLSGTLNQQKAGIGLDVDAVKKLKDAEAKALPMLQSVREIDKRARALEEFQPGVVNQMKSQMKFALDSFAQVNGAPQYVAAINGALTKIVKGDFGDVGNVTAGEREAAQEYLGKPTAPLSIKLELIDGIYNRQRNTIEARMDKIKDLTPEKMWSDYGTLYDALGGDDWLFAYLKKRKARIQGKPRIQMDDNLDVLDVSYE